MEELQPLVEYKFDIYLRKTKTPAHVVPQIKLRAGEQFTVRLVAKVCGKGVNLEGYTAQFIIIYSDDSQVSQTCTIEDNTISCLLDDNMTLVPGRCKDAFFKLTKQGDNVLRNQVITTETIDLEIQASQGATTANKPTASAGIEFDEEALKDLQALKATLEQSFSELREMQIKASAESIEGFNQKATELIDNLSTTVKRKIEEADALMAVIQSNLANNSEAQRKNNEAQATNDLAAQQDSAKQKTNDTKQDANDKRQAANDIQQAKNNADQIANNNAKTGLEVVKLQSGQYNPETKEPTLSTGETGKIYLVPASRNEKNNKYLEYCWIGDGWEIIGDTATTFSAIKTDTIDAIVSQKQARNGDDVLNTTGLNYLNTLYQTELDKKLNKSDYKPSGGGLDADTKENLQQMANQVQKNSDAIEAFPNKYIGATRKDILSIFGAPIAKGMWANTQGVIGYDAFEPNGKPGGAQLSSGGQTAYVFTARNENILKQYIDAGDRKLLARIEALEKKLG